MKRVVVIGGGIVGLSTAWFLQRAGAEVTVLDRGTAGAAASWGNAGWVSPAFSVPLAEPAALRLGLKSLFSRASPVSVPLLPDANTARFLGGFAAHCRASRWEAGLRALTPLNLRALRAYGEMAAAGIGHGPRRMDPGLVFTPRAHDLEHLASELAAVRAAGQDVDADVLDIAEARALAPMVSPDLGGAMRLNDQYFMDPRQLIASLASDLRAGGASIEEDTEATDIHADGTVTVTTRRGRVSADAAVVANGAWLGAWRRKLGMRHTVQAGRGYSFSVRPASLPAGPLYFPAHRVVATPMGGRLRISGMMEFRHPDAPLDPRRLRSVVRTIEPLLPGIDFGDRAEEWVGSRPCTSDGLPLVGPSRLPGVYVNGGYGMWGLTLGPAGGQALARSIMGAPEPVLAGFDPQR